MRASWPSADQLARPMMRRSAGLEPHQAGRQQGSIDGDFWRLVHRGLQPFRRLHDCSGCFRLERLPGGACTHWNAPLSHGAHGSGHSGSQPGRRGWGKRATGARDAKSALPKANCNCVSRCRREACPLTSPTCVSSLAAPAPLRFPAFPASAKSLQARAQGRRGRRWVGSRTGRAWRATTLPRRPKLRAPCRLAIATALRNSRSAASTFSASRFESTWPRTRRSSPSNAA